MLARAARGLAYDGDWLVAERQTDGRGRQGRGWSSPEGNLYASALVTLRPADPPAPTLALVAGVALHASIARPGVTLKWPNDLLAGDAKLAGILLERTGSAVVVGFGVNVASAPYLAGRLTASLRDLGDTRSAAHLIGPLADELKHWTAVWREGGLTVIRAAWLARSYPPGTLLAAQASDGRLIEGQFAGLDDDLALLLRLADGRTRAIHAGDVFLI